MAVPECARSLDLALVVDGTFLIAQSGPGNWDLILSFLHDLVSKFDLSPGGTRVAAVVYGDVAQIVFHLDTYTTRVRLI